MKPSPAEAAVLSQPTAQELKLSGFWTARGIGFIERQIETVRLASRTDAVADGTRIEALDTAGAWVLQKLLLRLRGEGIVVTLRGLRPGSPNCCTAWASRLPAAAMPSPSAASPRDSMLEGFGREH